MNNNQNRSEDLQKIIKYQFKNKELLTQALTHRSYLNESREKNLSSNERLEFLGDAVLSFWVSNQLYKQFSELPEGKLTFIRTHLVRTETLAHLSKKLNFGNFLMMSKGEEIGGGRENPLLLANCFEAIIGAIFSDGGVDAVSKFLEERFTDLLGSVENPDQYKDSKSLLQEKVQADGLNFPIYKLVSSEGPDHQKVFTMAVCIDNKVLAEGTSRSKQEAEEEAARKALEIYDQRK